MGRFKKWIVAPLLATIFPTQAYKVTSGTVTADDSGNLTVTSAACRVDFPKNDGEDLTVQFTYNGPSDTVSLLASGAYQSQYGLKLRSANTCNLVYVMRRISPVSTIVVSYKQNIGMSTHEECGANGYTSIKSILVPSPVLGVKEVLSAKFDEDILTVWLNDKEIWSGLVNYKVTGIGGVRTDNVKTTFRLLE